MSKWSVPYRRCMLVARLTVYLLSVSKKTLMLFCNSFDYSCQFVKHSHLSQVFVNGFILAHQQPLKIVSRHRIVSIWIDCRSFVANQFRLGIISNIRQILMMIFIWQPIDFLLLLQKSFFARHIRASKQSLSFYSLFGWTHPNSMSISICKQPTIKQMTSNLPTNWSRNVFVT